MGNSVIDVGKLAKPVDTFVNKISGAIGILYEPTRIKRKAKADAEANKIAKLNSYEIEKLSIIETRAINRLIVEETRKQENIESIIGYTIDNLNENSHPENLNDDWLFNYFDKCKFISDKEMQIIWSNILTNETNKSGTYSKRTINLLSSIEKEEAKLFTDLCGFVWKIAEDNVPLILDYEDTFYKNNEITFNKLNHLCNIGLINFDAFGYEFNDLKTPCKLAYFNKNYSLDNLKSIEIGNVSFTSIGEELYNVVNSISINGFDIYIIEKLRSKGIIIIEV